MNSYNEISYRYVEIKDEFYIPPSWRYQDKNNRQASAGSFYDEALLKTYKESLDSSLHAYKALLAEGVARELARGVLPLCTYTEFIFTCNLHSLMHFLKSRLDMNAQYEIRCYAKGLLELATPHFPISLEAWQLKSFCLEKQEPR